MYAQQTHAKHSWTHINILFTQQPANTYAQRGLNLLQWKIVLQNVESEAKSKASSLLPPYPDLSGKKKQQWEPGPSGQVDREADKRICPPEQLNTSHPFNLQDQRATGASSTEE